MTSLELLICAGLVSISAFLSSSEVALFSLSRFQLRELKANLRPAIHRNIKRLLGDPGGLLITILVFNEIVNISLSTIVADVIVRSGISENPLLSHVPSWLIHTLLGTLITAPIVLFLCEVTPKVVAAKANQLIATLTSGPLSLVYDGFKPVRTLLAQLVMIISQMVSRSTNPEVTSNDKDTKLKESDFLLMVEEGHKEGAIHRSELDLIKNVFDLDDTIVEDIFKPMSRVFSIPSSMNLKTALGTVRAQKYSRIPVIGPNQLVLGVIYSKDLLRMKLEPEFGNTPVSNIVRKPLVVSPTLRLNSLFRKFKQERNHMAIVVSATGEPLGIVTMSDVLNALFEDILEGKA